MSVARGVVRCDDDELPFTFSHLFAGILLRARAKMMNSAETASSRVVVVATKQSAKYVYLRRCCMRLSKSARANVTHETSNYYISGNYMCLCVCVWMCLYTKSIICECTRNKTSCPIIRSILRKMFEKSLETFTFSLAQTVRYAMD